MNYENYFDKQETASNFSKHPSSHSYTSIIEDDLSEDQSNSSCNSSVKDDTSDQSNLESISENEDITFIEYNKQFLNYFTNNDIGSIGPRGPRGFCGPKGEKGDK